MKTKWIIEKDAFDYNLNDLFKALDNQGHEYKTVKYEPFESGSYGDMFNVHDCVMFYGSLNLMRQLQRDTKWIPGGYCDFEKFKCSSYYTQFGKHLLNDKYMMMTVAELIRNKDFVYDTLGIDDTIFVRPDSGAKHFAGKVVYKEKMSLEEMGHGFYYDDPSILTVISTPKKIQQEWRFVVGNKEIVAGSQYKNMWHNDLEVAIEEGSPEDVLEYAQEIAKIDWDGDPMYVMDICRSNGDLKLLELNSFSCAGLYDCDKDAIVKVASDIALKEWHECHCDFDYDCIPVAKKEI